ncbi:MAG TPA: hypothetical protein VGD08_11210 [Stellaceae bacterium]|jgi:hypothetical protein
MNAPHEHRVRAERYLRLAAEATTARTRTHLRQLALEAQAIAEMLERVGGEIRAAAEFDSQS